MNEQKDTGGILILVIAALAIAVASRGHRPPPQPINPEPAPVCPGPNCPRNPHKPWGANVGGTVAPDGSEIDIDLPMSQQLSNKGGRDGAGLCVFTSVNNAANWQGVPILRDLRDWMTKYPGGGTPDKLDKMIRRKCQEAGVPVPQYIQVEGLDLAILKEACAAGRMPSVTYGISPTGRYGGRPIGHMVNIQNAGKYYAVLDNNYICTPQKPNNIEWLTEEEFIRSHKHGGAWSVILLSPPPPPLPKAAIY